MCCFSFAPVAALGGFEVNVDRFRASALTIVVSAHLASPFSATISSISFWK
jgi:hypothetical protein